MDTSQGTTLDQVANYSCNNGYLLVGNMTRTCQLDGMWSGTEPFCRKFQIYLTPVGQIASQVEKQKIIIM